MYGIVTILPEPLFSSISKTWNDLEAAFGITGVKITPFPHFSWLIAENLDINNTIKKIEDLSKIIKPFTVKINSIRQFKNNKVVIYLGIENSENLVSAHKLIWNSVEKTSTELSEYYSPRQWIPHITMVLEDNMKIDKEAIFDFLDNQNLKTELEVKNLAVIYQPEKGTSNLVHLKKIIL